jgi:pimeloyl-ACP methyl ester carboxylesterase
VHQLDPGLLLRMFRSMQAHDGETILDDLDVPLLVFAGNADGLTPLRRMTEIAIRGRGQLVVIPGGSHTLPAECPGEIAAHLGPFLTAVDERAAPATGAGTVLR